MDDTFLDPFGLLMLIFAGVMFVVLLAMMTGGVHVRKQEDAARRLGMDPNYCYLHKRVD